MPLRIEDLSSGITIPLSNLGMVIYAEIRSCNDDNLSRLPNIVLSSDAHWDPHSVRFPAHWGDGEVAGISQRRVHVNSTISIQISRLMQILAVYTLIH